MPQLRHAETSALLAEADDPLDLALVADSIGLDRVVFDDVGLAFDPVAAVAAARAREDAAADLGADERQVAEEHRAHLEGPVAEAVVALIDAEDPDPVPVVVVPPEA